MDAINCGGIMFDVPEDVNPLSPVVPVAVQEKTASARLDVNVIGLVAIPEQVVCERTEFVKIGSMFTVKVLVAVTSTPHSFFTVKVTVYVPGVL